MKNVVKGKTPYCVIFLFLKVRLKTSYTIAEAQQKLEQYCAYQERCHLEVSRKLTTLGIIPSAQEQIRGHLIEHNYLNESRFAQSFVRGKFRIKKWGKERIVRELKQRQISPYNIRLGLKEIDADSYEATLNEVAKKFWRQYNQKSLPLRKKKVYDALRYRGWENDLIWEAITQLEIHSKS